jgi:putative pyruvate formate lyase activating enzyme
MLSLQDSGAHNINLVTPSHYALQLIDVLKLARKNGLKIPVIWNTNSYERIETLQALEGLIDIYLPDFRYFDSDASSKYSDANDYPEIAQAALKEMVRQVGHLKEKDGIAQSGVMIRLLVIPKNVNRIDKVMKWIHDNLGPETFISLMGQYYPTYRSVAFPEINRSITEEEYESAVKVLTDLGFENGYIQGVGSNEDWTPKFVKT